MMQEILAIQGFLGTRSRQKRGRGVLGSAALPTMLCAKPFVKRYATNKNATNSGVKFATSRRKYDTGPHDDGASGLFPVKRAMSRQEKAEPRAVWPRPVVQGSRGSVAQICGRVVRPPSVQF